MKRISLLAAVFAAVLLFAPAASFADARTDFSEAMKAVSKGDATTAIDILTRIVDSGEQVDPRNMASVYNMRGMCYAAKSENEKAMNDFNKALELDPNLAEALGNRAFLWQTMGDVEKAKEDAKAAKRIDRKVDVPEFN